MLKKTAVIFIVLTCLMLCVVNTVTAQEYSEITISLNGEYIEPPVNPVIIDGVTLVPARCVFEALGMQIDWDGESQTVTGTKDELNIKMVIGSMDAEVNGESVKLLIPPQIIDNSTMVPVRFVAEATGCDVRWRPDTEEVVINTPESPFAFYMVSTDTIAYANALYSVPEISETQNLVNLYGYPNDDIYRIQYEISPGKISWMSSGRLIRLYTCVDDVIDWEYDGIMHTNTYGEILQFFSEPSETASKLNIDEKTITHEWMSEVFGQVYLDEYYTNLFHEDASRIVNVYFRLNDPSTRTFYIKESETGEFLCDDLKKILYPEIWMSEEEIEMTGICFEDADVYVDPDNILLTKMFSKENAILYIFTEMQENFIKEQDTEVMIFNDIRVKKSDGKFYFHKEDLIINEIITD